ncbi:hypothetical protein Pelo_738 [Pelomyxa schiedti]|nr:hypothetical protein Pelo_738 [Pelomyxa schiedti]
MASGRGSGLSIKTNQVYCRTGDTLSGDVHFFVVLGSQSKPVSSLVVVFDAYESSSSAGDVEPPKNMSSTKTVPSGKGKKRIYFAETAVLTTFTPEKQPTVGTHTYPFSFRVPPDGPPSCVFKSGKVKVEYRLTAFLTVANHPKVKLHKLKHVVRVGRPYLLEPVTPIDKKTVIKGKGNKADLQLDLALDKKTACPGDTVSSHIFIYNVSRKSVQYLELKLRQVLRFGSKTEKCTLLAQTVKEGFPIRKEEYDAHIPLCIPSFLDVQPSVVNAQQINCVYHISAKAIVSMGSNIKVHVPLSLSSFPPCESVSAPTSKFKFPAQIAAEKARAEDALTGRILMQDALSAMDSMMSEIESYSMFAAAGQLATKIEVPPNTTLESSSHEVTACTANVGGIIAQLEQAATKPAQAVLGEKAKLLADLLRQLCSSLHICCSTMRDTVSCQGAYAAIKAFTIAGQQLILASKDMQQYSTDALVVKSFNLAKQAVTGSARDIDNFIANSTDKIGAKLLDDMKVILTKIAPKTPTVRGKTSFINVTTALNQLKSAIVDLKNSFERPYDQPEAAQAQITQSTKAVIDAMQLLFDLIEELPLETSRPIVENVKSTRAVLINYLDTFAKGCIQASLINEVNTALESSLQVLETSVGSAKAATAALRGSSGGAPPPPPSVPPPPPPSSPPPIPPREASLTTSARTSSATPATPGNAEEEMQLLAAEMEALARAFSSSPAASGVRASASSSAAAAIAVNEETGQFASYVAMVANASAAIVTAAARAQKNIGTVRKGAVYNRDNQWSEGLLSAAKCVAECTKELVAACNACVNGDQSVDETRLVATCKTIASTTAQLVASCKVKTAPGSEDQVAVVQAAGGVAKATAQLVTHVKSTMSAPSAPTNTPEVESQLRSTTGTKVKELEQQMRILQLEKQLEDARKDMLSSRKSSYVTKTTSSS